jgi:UDP-N-acetylmuramoylalanine--D-glutamate ligase
MNRVAAGKRALLVGLGKTGVSCAQHLAKRGWTLAATDSRRDPPGAAQLRSLAPEAAVHCGAFDAGLLGGADMLVVSPGVSLAEPIVQQARNLGIDVVGDIELFARAADAPVVGITGTNGKSTVTTLLGRMAERAGLQVKVGGNLGTPALDLLENTQAPQLYVLELSSFQLDSTVSLTLLAAAVLNVTPDHMDRYATPQAYANSKARIYARCGTAVLNLDDAQVRAMPTGAARRLGFSLKMPDADYALSAGDGLQRALTRHGKTLLTLSALRLSGLHNAANALASLALGEAAGLPMPVMLEELREFSGLPHRSQWVADIAGVRYINDSKGTNVGATLAAVAGMRGPLILIAGGDGKGQDFTPLANAFTGKVRHAVLLGRDAAQLARALHGVCGLHLCATLDEAVAKAASLAQPGDTVLLSPACASLDMFRDYAQRGELFSAAVMGLNA